MPTGGQIPSGVGLRLQATFPGTVDGGNADISGVMRAERFTTSKINAGAEVVNSPQIFGSGHTYGGTDGEINIMFGISNTIQTSQNQNIVIGYSCSATRQSQVAIGTACAAGGAAITDSNVAIGRSCSAGNKAADTSHNVALGSGCSASAMSVAVGRTVNCAGNATNFDTDTCIGFGRDITFPNSPQGVGIGKGITVSAKTNVLVVGWYAGDQPTPVDNSITIGRPSQTKVQLGPHVIDAGFTTPNFRQTASVTVANTVAETTLIGAGVGSATIPAARLAAGTVVRVKARGTIGDTGTPTFRLKVKLGGVTYIDTTAIAFGAFTGRHGWQLEADITIRTNGAGGTALGNGIMMVSTAGNPDLDSINEATTGINTTAANALDVTAQWGTANALNSIICTNLTMEVLG